MSIKIVSLSIVCMYPVSNLKMSLIIFPQNGATLVKTNTRKYIYNVCERQMVKISIHFKVMIYFEHIHSIWEQHPSIFVNLYI